MPTYDTTTADESTHARQPLNAEDDTLVSLTVPADELWYVDAVHLTADGTGDDTVGVQCAVADTTTLDALEPSLDRAGRGGQAGIDTAEAAGATIDIDAYATAGEELRVAEVSDAGTTGGYHYSVAVRRVL
jgi:hypothetical protein